jgi:NTP pyrophosphatase (non-canonical NTP hydrolase)
MKMLTTEAYEALVAAAASGHFNCLTAAEDERLTILSEEASEVIKAIAKIQRHGYESYNPNRPQDGNNREQLEQEIGDLSVAIKMMIHCSDIQAKKINEATARKEADISRYLHHQE